MAAKKKTKQVINSRNVGQVFNDIKASQIYKATLKNFGKVFESTGETVLEAITNLQPGNVKARAILTVERDGKKRERILQPMAVQRLFSASKMMREIQLKQVSMLFDV